MRQLRIAVIGGGISGLAAANHLRELDSAADVTLFESGGRLGGVIHTEHHEGFLIEHGAENFITTMPWGVDLCERIGFDDELVPTNAQHRRAFVLHKGRLKPIPSGFAIMAPSRIWPILSTSILSPAGKLRLAGELVARRRTDDQDESLASFVKRRLGREAYERLVQPLVGGIYTADPERLSVDATMPRFRQMEREYGSLIRAMWNQKRATAKTDKQASGARYSQFVAPRNGMATMIDAIADRLSPNTVRLNTRVDRLRCISGGEWRVSTSGQSQEELAFDGVVVALPARHVAGLLKEVDSKLSDHLAAIDYSSCALASFGFRRDQIQHPLDGFGVVIPIVEQRRILSATFSSTKYPGRAPDGQVLIRTYIGGACQPELLTMDDDELLAIAYQELADILGIHDQPIYSHINRQRTAMPQYHVGHLAVVQQITERMNNLHGLVLAGNSLHGVGVPQCIHSAQAATAKLLSTLTSDDKATASTTAK